MAPPGLFLTSDVQQQKKKKKRKTSTPPATTLSLKAHFNKDWSLVDHMSVLQFQRFRWDGFY